MTIDEFEAAQYFNIEGNGVEIFILKKQDDEFFIERFQTNEEDQETIFNRVKENFSNSILEKTNVVNLSSYDDLITNIYKYDLEVGENIKLRRITDFSGIEENFCDDLSKIYGIIYKIGSSQDFMVIYSQNYAFINTFSNKYLLGFRQNSTFKLTEERSFRLNMSPDIVYKNGEFYILNLKVAEKNFGITEVIVSHATESINKIQGLEIVSNLEVLGERVSEIAFSRKLMKIKTDSPVFRISKDNIIEFSKSNRIFKNKFNYDSENKIHLDTKESQNLLIRLLNDDAVHSELTGEDYFANSKDKA